MSCILSSLVVIVVLVIAPFAIGITWSYLHRSGTYLRDDGSTDGRGG